MPNLAGGVKPLEPERVRGLWAHERALILAVMRLRNEVAAAVFAAGLACGSDGSGTAAPAGSAGRPLEAAKTGRPVIDTARDARMLARVIYSDLAVYQVEKIDGLPPERLATALDAELAEARELFRLRVAPEQYGIFEEEFDLLLRAVSHRLKLDTEDSARFLARSMLTKVMRDQADGDARPAIQEARSFFKERVPERQHAAFEDVAADVFPNPAAR